MRPVSIVLTSVLAATIAFPAIAADKKINLPTYQIKQNSILLKIGGVERSFLFDTGEGMSMISPKLAQEVKCEPWGNEVGFRMLGERFEAPHCDNLSFDLQGTRLHAKSVFVYDVSELTEKDAPALDGAIGLDLFDGKIITLDYSKNTLYLNDATSLKKITNKAREIPFRVMRYATGGIDIFAGVTTSKGLAWMTIDSANAGPTIFVAPAIAPLLGLNPDSRERQPVTARIGEFTFSGKARVFEKMIMDGNIGMQFLRDHVLTIDLKNDRAWVQASN